MALTNRFFLQLRITVHCSLVTGYCLLITSSPVCAASTDNPSSRSLVVAPFAQYFQWEESGLYVKESGMIYGLGAMGGIDLFTRGRLSGGVDLFAGEVNYDGTRWDSRPFRSKTLYLGVKAETDVAVNVLKPGSTRVEPFLGLGMRWWKRRLDNTDENLYGYDENWLTLYGRAGLRGQWLATADWSFTAEAAALLPLYNYETVYLKVSQDSSSFSLNPGRQISPVVQAGAGWKDYRLILYYERLDFGTSDVGESGFYQPESTADIVGVKVGVSL